MNRNYLIGIISGIIIIVATIFFVLRKHQPVTDSAYNAIPLDAALIIDVKSYPDLKESILHNNKIWNELATLQLFDPLKRKIELFDSLEKSNPLFKNLLEQKAQILISGHPTGKDNIQLTYYIKLDGNKEFRHFDEMIEQWPGTAITERKYETSLIRDVIMQTARNNFSYTYASGLLILSESSILLENAVRQLEATESVIHKNELSELIKTAGKNSVTNIYLNYTYFPRLFPQVFHARYAGEVNFASGFSDWIELDLNVKPDLMIFNGFSICNDNRKKFANVFLHQSPLKLEIFGNIPTAVNTFGVLGISDLNKYLADYRLFLEQTGKLNEYNNHLNDIETRYNIDLQADISSIFENEACFAFSDQLGDTSENQSFTLLRLKSVDDAEKIVNGWIDDYAGAEKSASKNFISEVKLDNDVSFKIYQVPFANIPASLFGEIFSGGTNEYCALTENYMIFGNSPLAIKNYLHNIILHSTLGTDLEFNNFSDYFSNQYNFFFYNKPAISGSLYNQFLRKNLADDITTNAEHIAKLQAMVYQFNVNSNKGLLYNNIFVKYSRQPVETPSNTIWESALEGNLVIKPVLVTNHTNNDTEIFVEDDKNNIYLINKVGRILWKINIGEPILGTVYQIDFYKNRKLQYLFNTKSKMHLIDRNGNETEKFPVELRSPATNGIAVFDYDHNRNYRIFVAGADQKIYSYDKEGKLIKGWDFGKTEGPVTQPVQHYRYNNMDYLVFTDNYRVYIVNRRGDIRVKTDKNFPISPNNSVDVLGTRNHKEFRFAITDTAGTVHLIDLKGNTSTVKLGYFPPDHYFNLVDVDADGRKDYVFASGNSLKAFSQSGKLILDIQTNYLINTPPAFYELKSMHYEIGLVDTDNGKIYLYDRQGNVHDGFPLEGNTQFSIGLLNNSVNRFNLIVGSKKNFLYNYSVQ